MKADKIEEQIFFKNCNLIKKKPGIKKFQMSINSLILSNMENLIYNNLQNADTYRNIYFSGGVLNSPDFSFFISQSYEDIVNTEDSKAANYHFPQPLMEFKKDIQYTPPRINDNIYSFFKGANYLSKIDSLDSLMINRQDYYEKGKNQLGFIFL